MRTLYAQAYREFLQRDFVIAVTVKVGHNFESALLGFFGVQVGWLRGRHGFQDLSPRHRTTAVFVV